MSNRLFNFLRPIRKDSKPSNGNGGGGSKQGEKNKKQTKVPKK